MRKTEQLLREFSGFAANPAAQLKALTAAGKKAVAACLIIVRRSSY
jgi:hypothetical protein